LAYPFVLVAYSSMTSRVLGEPGKFLGFRNSLTLLQDSLFRQTVCNCPVYAVSSVVLKMVLGVILALLANQEIPARNLIRGALLLPWIVPTSLSVLTWRLQPSAVAFHLTTESWRGKPSTARPTITASGGSLHEGESFRLTGSSVGEEQRLLLSAVGLAVPPGEGEPPEPMLPATRVDDDAVGPPGLFAFLS
jgi:hypothetical protein